MKPNHTIHLLALTLSLASASEAKWFSSTPDVKSTLSWDAGRCHQWLLDQGISVPKSWGVDKMQELVAENWDAAMKAAGVRKDDSWMAGIKSGAFNTWSESQLRGFLLQHGVVSPNSKKEELELMAKEQYDKLQASAASLQNLVYGSVTSAASVASASAYSAADVAASSASSAYNAATTNVADNAQWAYHAAADSISSNAQWAKNYVTAQMNDASDYVWSSWSDNEMRSYLEKKGIIKTKTQMKRDELVSKLKESYSSATDPVYHAWSDSYLKSWLVKENLIKSDAAASRDQLLDTLKDNYYTSKDFVYSEWTDSQLKQWLVDHNLVKSSAQYKRAELLDLFAHNYASSVDTVAGSWKESDMRQFLIDKHIMKSDRQAKKDEMVKMIKEKGISVSDQMSEYYIWSNARLKAYLRSTGVSGADLPQKRDELLSLTQQKWDESSKRVDTLLQSVKSHLINSVGFAEEKLMHALGIVGVNAAAMVKDGAEYVGTAASSASSYAASQSAHADL